MRLRFAGPRDVPALLDVYRAYIPTTVTFEYVLPSREEFGERVSSMGAVYPYLVAEEDGQVLGYAYAHRIAERAAYAWGAELSIYLRPDAAGRGLGKRMYRALTQLLALQGVRTVYGLVASPNPASEALHSSMGFRVMGVQRRAGYKNGRWIDLIWYEKEIGSYDPEPGPIVPIGSLPSQTVRGILEQYS